MVASEETAILIEEIKLSDGLIINLSTVTTDDIDDFITLSALEKTRFGMAFTTADGTDQEAYHSTNIMTLNVSGIATVLSIGESVKSTGGST